MSPDAALEIRESVPLAPLTTIGIGGPARWFATATTCAQVAAAHAWCRERNVPLHVIAGGSNLVIADRGVHALVLKMGIMGCDFEPLSAGAVRFTVGAGERWDEVVEAVVQRDLAGLECLSGIPGTTGGTPIQNVGAYGQEVAETIESVGVFDRQTAHVAIIAAADCGFSYRMSRFKAEPDRFIVTHVTFRLRPGTPTLRYPDLRAWTEHEGLTQPGLRDVRAAVIAVRRTKGMVVDIADPDSRSVGSFFMNPVVTFERRDAIAAAAGTVVPAFPAATGLVKIPAAWLIERAGFRKGHIDGNVGISTKHPLALVNRGGATAHDVLRLATSIKRQVAEQFSVFLRPEPVLLGLDDDPQVEYLRSRDGGPENQ